MDAGQYMEAECKEAGRGKAGGYLAKSCPQKASKNQIPFL
jgi:hypothetical protein